MVDQPGVLEGHIRVFPSGLNVFGFDRQVPINRIPPREPTVDEKLEKASGLIEMQQSKACAPVVLAHFW